MSEFMIIFAREFKARVQARAFIIGTLLVPLFLAIAIAVPRMGSGGSLRNFVVINEATPDLGQSFVDNLTTISTNTQDNTYHAELRQAQWNDVRAELNAQVLSSRIDGYVVIPADILEKPSIRYFARSVSSMLVVRDLQMAASRAAQGARIRSAGVDPSELSRLMQPVIVDGSKITKDGEQKASLRSSFLAAYLVAFLIYMLIIIYGVNIMRSVLEEKSSRIAEVVLSSVSAGKFLAGKLFGETSAALLQVAIWCAMVVVVMTNNAVATRVGIPPQVLQTFAIEPVQVALLFAFFILGFLLYASFFASIGAAVTSEQEAQSMQMMALIPTFIPLFSIVTLTNNPTGRLATVLSLVPFTSPIAMPVRLAASPVPWFEIATAIALLVVTLIAMLWAAGKIFRIGVLTTGKKPSAAELWRWVKEAG